MCQAPRPGAFHQQGPAGPASRAPPVPGLAGGSSAVPAAGPLCPPVGQGSRCIYSLRGRVCVPPVSPRVAPVGLRVESPRTLPHPRVPGDDQGGRGDAGPRLVSRWACRGPRGRPRASSAGDFIYSGDRNPISLFPREQLIVRAALLIVCFPSAPGPAAINHDSGLSRPLGPQSFPGSTRVSAKRGTPDRTRTAPAGSRGESLARF